jgi:hypothetical protein
MAEHELFDDEERQKLEGQLKLLGLKHQVEKSNGFLTKSGKLVNYHEWHALAAGAGLVGLGHLYSGVFILIYALLMLKAVASRILGRESSGLVREISKELQYYIVGGLATALIFLGAGFPIPDVPVSIYEVAKAILGA